VYRLALRLFDSRVALASAVFLAVAPLHVRDSHYIKHDVPATLVVVLAYLAMARVWPTTGVRAPSPRDVLLAGAACGLAFATHYYCVFLAAPLLWVILRAYGPLGWRAVALQATRAAAVSAVVFFALSPFLLVEPATAWRDITANRQIVVDRAVSGGAFAPALRYANILVTDATGAPVAIAGIAGAIWMLVASPGRAVLLLAFAVPFFAFISNTVPASRYLNPILPMITIFAAWTLLSIAARFRAHPWMLWGVVGVCAAPALLQSVRADLFFRVDDTRTVARRFIEQRIPPHSTILIQPYSVPLTPSREGLLEALRANLGSSDVASVKFQLQLAQTPYPEPSYRLIFLGTGGLDAEKIYVDYAELGGPAGLAPLRRLGVAYVVLKRYTRSDPVMNPLLTALDREARRVATFSPYRPGTSETDMLRIEPFLHNTDTRIVGALERPGPPLEIWQLDGSGF
ncbi:MAG: glycosyltransferase family 39 protein, partial [Acidobacteria bacterium]|nr:glycosyltransferase family 39 protein [Acidobacteriota bacterium]